MISEKDDLHLLIHIREIIDQFFQCLIASIDQGQILVYIRIITIGHPHILGKVRILIGITTVILHGNAHDKELLIRIFRLILRDDLIVKLLVRNVFTHNVALIKIIDKITLGKSKQRINLISTPAGRVIRMHGHTVIAIAFERADQ